MDPLQFLFSYQGRIGRAHYWTGVLIAAVAAALYVLAEHFLHSFYLTLGVLLLICFPAIYIAIGFGIRRLNDRNKSNRWLLLFYLGPLALFFGAHLTDGSAAAGVLSTAGLVVLIWAIVELGAVRGSIGVNPHGPDPVAPKPAQH
jgi:uncharacterized membrane protein YhaH (DUF805 family)